MPTITVITVCFNAEKYIEQTIKSVLEQKNIALEYIIVDGGSSDTTLDIIKRNEPSIDRYISESDKGIADAMNKGVALATGDYVLFLHADDYLYSDDALKMAVPYLKGQKDIYIFDTIFSMKKGNLRKHSGSFGRRILFKGICHQGVLCRRDLLLRLGGFDESFKICMDYNFFMKAYLNSATAKYIDEVLSVMRDTGISSRQDWQSLKQRFMEEKRVHIENGPTKLMQAVYKLYWAMYLPYRKAGNIKNRLLNVI
ncbi:MAG: glycosyltransferase family 2 protein [Cycloclasticus sp.]